MSTVTVLCTVFNAADYLPRALGSVLEQTFEDWEMLVMDDGSTERGVADTLAAISDPRVVVRHFHPTDRDRRAACRYATLVNWGATRTRSEYVTYLCGDDYFLPDRLERMVRKLRQGHDVVYGSQLLLDWLGEQFGVRETTGVLDDAYHRVDMNSVMHTRESFVRAGGWPTGVDVWRDADGHFWRRLTGAGYRFTPVDGGPTDCKHYRRDSVDRRVIDGREPWL